MEFVIAFDTNVLLKESDDCLDFIYEILENTPPRFKIAVDCDNHILSEYESIYEEQVKELKKKPSGYLTDLILGQVISLITKSAGAEDAYVAWLDAEFPSRERKEHLTKLATLGCDQQIEP